MRGSAAETVVRAVSWPRVILVLSVLVLLRAGLVWSGRAVEAIGPGSGPPPVRVLLVTGGHLHDLEFYSILNRPEWRVTVDPHPAAFASDIRQRYDVVVLYDMVRSIDEARQRNLRDFVESGKGVVALHHAVCANVDWKWWVEEVIGGRYLFEPFEGRVSSYIHDRRQNITVAVDHPVTRGIGDFQIVDETYKNLWISPRVKVLLRSDDATSDGPVAWIGPHQRSRVVYLQLGHDRQAYLNPKYSQLVRQAIGWAAGR
jgi:uncharacterized protein